MIFFTYSQTGYPKFIIILFILVCISFISSCGKNRTDNNQQLNQETKNTFSVIDSFLKDLEQNGFNGSVLVAQGEDVFKNGYGFADTENKILNSSETVFDIGSVTKQFTAAAILKLEMQKKLSVTDPITKFFTSVPEDKQSITIHHLLTHSSGFKHDLGRDYDPLTRKQFISEALKSKLLFTPGSRFEYSNVGYSILTGIIEKVSGISYEEYLNINLFKPAGMKQTGYTLPEWNDNNIAAGYMGSKRWGKPNEKPWDKNGPYWNLLGNGGILSSVEDLYLWHIALLDDTILDSAAKKKFYTKHIEEGEGMGSYYGYGWALFPTPRNTTLVTHNGSNGIFFCSFLRYLTEEVTIILLCNSFKEVFHSIDYQVARTLFQKDYQPELEMREGTNNLIIIED